MGILMLKPWKRRKLLNEMAVGSRVYQQNNTISHSSPVAIIKLGEMAKNNSSHIQYALSQK